MCPTAELLLSKMLDDKQTKTLMCRNVEKQKLFVFQPCMLRNMVMKKDYEGLKSPLGEGKVHGLN